MASTFEFKKSGNGEFVFSLKKPDGGTLLTSETYTTRASAENGIESVRKNSAEDGRYERKESTNGRPYFVLKAGNGQVIGKSIMYNSAGDMENAIQYVKDDAAAATINDLTAEA